MCECQYFEVEKWWPYQEKTQCATIWYRAEHKRGVDKGLIQLTVVFCFCRSFDPFHEIFAMIILRCKECCSFLLGGSWDRLIAVMAIATLAGLPGQVDSFYCLIITTLPS